VRNTFEVVVTEIDFLRSLQFTPPGDAIPRTSREREREREGG
jgi:hypothetical protein